MAYTVDEVSERLEVPRPTLYRYLREYSIPHRRRAGKIYVPEESFDRIKEVRELHKEGLGTESVRRRLQEEETGPDVEGIEERLDCILEALEDLRGDPKPASGAMLCAQTLQTILARQNLLIRAISDLNETLEERLPDANYQLRNKAASPVGDPEETLDQEPSLEQPETLLERENGLAADELAAEASTRSVGPAPTAAQHGRFGVLARRRRLGALAILLALLGGVALVIASNGEEGSAASREGAFASFQEVAQTQPEEAPAPLHREQYQAPGTTPESSRGEDVLSIR